MKIQALGTADQKYQKNIDSIKAAVSELGFKDQVELVTDAAVISSMGVTNLPGFAVDGKILASGTTLNKKRAKSLIEKYLESQAKSAK